MSASRQPFKIPEAPLHCAQCHEHNPREKENCVKCHAPLWQICRNCQKRCPRAASRCVRCVEPLGGGLLAVVRRAVRKTVRKLTR